MRNNPVWARFDEVYCLTLEGDVERQIHASAELCRVGLPGFTFVEGVKASSDEVRDAYKRGAVKRFPPCFRCGAIRCGRPDCNNILIAPQVAVCLSFQRIFARAAASGLQSFLVVEDDVMFHAWALDLAAAALGPDNAATTALASDAPCLIGLGKGIFTGDAPAYHGEFALLAARKQPQNPCFAFNRSFAELALARFDTIYHTADVYIHFDLADEAQHFSLEPPLAYELSASTGALPSRIHPKRIALDSPGLSPQSRAEAEAALVRHLKHVITPPLVVLGLPRGGTRFIAQALAEFGLDIGDERMGADGISSWIFAVDDVDLPFGADLYARNSRFVHADLEIAVVRSPREAIFSLQLENTKSIQSYAFRRRWIQRAFDVDLDAFRSDFERALTAYVYWLRLIELRKPSAWIRLEQAAQDLPQVFAAGILAKRRDPELSRLGEPVNAGKPYLGQIYERPHGDFEARFRSCDPALQKAFRLVAQDLSFVFHGVL
jgi:hypothetical protein